MCSLRVQTLCNSVGKLFFFAFALLQESGAPKHLSCPLPKVHPLLLGQATVGGGLRGNNDPLKDHVLGPAHCVFIAWQAPVLLPVASQNCAPPSFLAKVLVTARIFIREISISAVIELPQGIKSVAGLKDARRDALLVDES